ncbi:MAG: FkbM family methyltransferase [Chitinophagaceae bacterium]|nr:MAG: FkbM family methyltransferase [Chitinophagaceae bacterium]
MGKLFKKIQFVKGITAGLPSMVSLIWGSKRLRWNKTGFVKAKDFQAITAIHIRHSHGKRKLYLRTYAGDIDIFYEIFFKEIYALPPLRNKEVKVVIDLGANIGLSALYFLQQYPATRLLCVEPDVTNVEILLKNLRQEISSGQVQLYEAAAMGADGFVAFESAEAKYNSRVTTGAEVKNIAAISIPTLIKNAGITTVDLLKIDVEGAEKFIFNADTSWLICVDNILIEVHSAEDRSVCMKAFNEHHFEVETIDADPNNGNLLWARKMK